MGLLWFQSETEALQVYMCTLISVCTLQAFWIDSLNYFPAQKHHLQTCKLYECRKSCQCRVNVNGALRVWDLIASPVSRFSGNIMTHQAVKKRVFSFQNDKSSI